MVRTGDTVFALSSGLGRAGVAVIRLSGPRAGAALSALAGPLPTPRRAVVRELREPGEAGSIDRAMVIWMPAPASFTGENCAELHIHGGRAVIDATVNALGRIEGLRPAERGEFTRRAFLNGKMDLTAAEATADLIDAETDAQRRQALRQASGELATLYDGWRARLIAVMSLVEATIDFSDEADVSTDQEGEIRAQLTDLAEDMAGHLADGRRGEILRDGFHVALAGPPNAGKSSLLNALARRELAIVSPEAGTTRDVLEARLDLNGLPIILSDTAGLRAAQGAVEAEGIRRAIARAEAADMILWVTDGSGPDAPLPVEVSTRAADILHVRNKSDLTGRVSSGLAATGAPRSAGRQVNGAPAAMLAAGAAPDIAGSTFTATPERPEPMLVSAKTGEGIGPLVTAICQRAQARLGEPSALVPTRARHRHHVEAAHKHVRAMLAGSMGDIELRAEDLRFASIELGRITGRVDVEDLLDRIFSTFCIGK